MEVSEDRDIYIDDSTWWIRIVYFCTTFIFGRDIVHLEPFVVQGTS